MSAKRFFSPATITFLVGLIYLAAIIIGVGGDPLELARIGTQFSESDPTGSEGYDGQFVYYIAIDPNPEILEDQLDVPAYRHQRILLPLLARGLSIGNQALIPWLLPMISLIVHSVAVLLLSKLLEKWSLSRWYALIYGLWLGLMLALRLDLPEALAFGLVIAAIFFQLKGSNGLSWLFYALAVFAKETTLFFVAAQLVAYLFNRRWRELLSLSLFALLPYALFQSWLFSSYGSFGISSGGIRATPMEWIPFNGLWRLAEFDLGIMFTFLLIYLPTLIIPTIWGLWISIKWIIQNKPDIFSLALFLNALIVPFLPFSLYSEPYGAFRFATGLVLASLLFAARHSHKRVLNYAMFWILLNLILFAEVFV